MTETTESDIERKQTLRLLEEARTAILAKNSQEVSAALPKQDAVRDRLEGFRQRMLGTVVESVIDTESPSNVIPIRTELEHVFGNTNELSVTCVENNVLMRLPAGMYVVAFDLEQTGKFIAALQNCEQNLKDSAITKELYSNAPMTAQEVERLLYLQNFVHDDFDKISKLFFPDYTSPSSVRQWLGKYRTGDEVWEDFKAYLHPSIPYATETTQ